MDNRPETAEAIRAPRRTATIGGSEYELVFDNRAAMYSEDYARSVTQRRVSYNAVIGELAAGSLTGICAVAYGALRRGLETAREKPPTIAEFDRAATFEELTALRAPLQEEVAAYLGAGQGGSKNA